MQKLKKLAASALIWMLIAAQVVPASADTKTVSEKNGSENIDVKAKYLSGAVTPEVYSVDVSWGKMEFTYSVSGTRKWNPATHTYTDDTTAGWAEDGNEVTVVNHSNRQVNVGFNYQSDLSYSGVTGTFSVPSDTLDAGAEGNVSGADSVTAKLTLSGTLSSSVSEFTKVGSITVSLK